MGLKKLSTEQGFKTGIVSSTIFGGLGKGLLFFSTLLATYYFGTTQNTDLAYFLQNTQVQVCGFILAVNMAVVIPRGIYLNHQNDKETTIAFYNTIFVLYTFAGLLILLLFAINPAGITAAISKFPVSFLSEHRIILFFIPVAILFNFLYQLINDVFASFRRFTLPVLINALFAVIIIAALFIFHNRLREYSYLAGILAALMLCLFVQLFLLTRMGWHFSINFKLIPAKTWSFIGYTQVGQFFTLVSSFLPFYLLSGSAGALSAYNIAFQLISLPSIFAISQFSSVAGIKFTEHYAKGRLEDINAVFKKSCVFLLYICFPVAGLLVLCGKNMLQYFIHFSSAENLELAAGFISILALTIPAGVINTIMARLLMASQKIKIGFINQVIQNSLLIILSVFLFKQIGPLGLPIAILVMQLLNLISSFIIAKKYLQELDYAYVIKWFILILLLNGTAFSICYLAGSFFKPGLMLIGLFCLLYLLLIIVAGGIIKPVKKIIQQPLQFLRN